LVGSLGGPTKMIGGAGNAHCCVPKHRTLYKIALFLFIKGVKLGSKSGGQWQQPLISSKYTVSISHASSTLAPIATFMRSKPVGMTALTGLTTLNKYQHE
jgi:hypothetical protein